MTALEVMATHQDLPLAEISCLDRVSWIQVLEWAAHSAGQSPGPVCQYQRATGVVLDAETAATARSPDPGESDQAAAGGAMTMTAHRDPVPSTAVSRTPGQVHVN